MYEQRSLKVGTRTLKGNTRFLLIRIRSESYWGTIEASMSSEAQGFTELLIPYSIPTMRDAFGEIAEFKGVVWYGD